MLNYFNNNNLIRKSDSRKKSTPIILVFILCFVFAFLSQIIGGLAIGFAVHYLNLSFNQYRNFISSSYSMLLTTSISIALCFLWVYLYEKRKPVSLGFYKKNAAPNYIQGFLIGLLLMSIEAIILSITNNAYISKGDVSSYGLLSLIIVVISWIVQGASEEILIRGFALQAISARYNTIVGVLVSSIIFALLHMLNPGVSLLAIINLILFGILAALLALYTENLWASCALHSAWNFAEGNVYGFLVSGTNAYGGSFLYVQYKTNNLINGGLFGPEGGLADTLISAIAIIVLLLLISKKSKHNSSISE
ncbi:CPBP family intramembrane glutamic endopeptidase [Clostridium sp. C8-1-8]|uniref:CPBP family intramembrane glutamic endopeptidase n=1 Tax=Clostridium sp. C8-1-8 TaxID=2698831 RepID=UPI001368AD16|nr:CPBP family intramembrane glutamic endopeptidase [Clostridium sp. C8-1-8]